MGNLFGPKQLVAHPSTSQAGAQSVSAEVVLYDHDRMVLAYVVASTTQIVLPPPAASARRDGLWHSTCFEVFLRTVSGSYVEFNFAPSRAWAAYHFDGYRIGMRHLPLPFEPEIAASNTHAFRLHVTLPNVGLAFNAIALSVILDHGQEQRSYWALAHPPGDPDFHHADGFTLPLPLSAGLSDKRM